MHRVTYYALESFQAVTLQRDPVLLLGNSWEQPRRENKEPFEIQAVDLCETCLGQIGSLVARLRPPLQSENNLWLSRPRIPGVDFLPRKPSLDKLWDSLRGQPRQGLRIPILFVESGCIQSSRHFARRGICEDCWFPGLLIVTRPIVVGYRVKIPASIYLSVWSSKAVAMDMFYAALKEAGKDLGLRLPPDMVYQGGDPNRIRRAFASMNTPEEIDKAARVLLVAVATAVFGTKATRTGRISRDGNFGPAAKKLAEESWSFWSSLRFQKQFLHEV